MKPIRVVESTTVVLPNANVDTDQIIPARFLTVTTRHGLGQRLFADWRYDKEGNPRPDFVLNQKDTRGAEVLVAGDNFGCGSSREHAPWALLDYGFRAVVSTRFADIFRSNALKNGLLTVVVDEETHRALLAEPGIEVAIDLEAQTLRLPNGKEVTFPIDAFARFCLLNGKDELDFLLEQESSIAEHEKTLPSS
ncbi:MAG TPA: 3-isopropylmalate dehydratase small subunit [Vicinamibacteria bacterium]|nr:3-isopropylmalate dehydratase small subunit [Vicinamibacteria bacterium]